jgi:P-type conjugative transfer protein TrbJ
MTRRRLRALALATTLAGAAVMIAPAAAVTVFDPWNYGENVAQAARALEQIDNQVQALQNQVAMLDDMAKHLQSLDVSALNRITESFRRIERLMEEARQLTFEVSDLDARLQDLFPEGYSEAVTTDDHVAAAHERWQSTMDGFRQTMRLQAQVVENVQADQGVVGDLLAASERAPGSLAAQQAANELLALSTKQQLQIQTLLAAQFRAEALDDARAAQAEEAARAATERFLGDGSAYTPR